MTSAHTAADAAATRHRTGGPSRWVLALGLLALVGGGVLYGASAAQLVWPDVFDGPLSYGRLLPASTTILLYGWLALGGLAAAWFVVPRLGGTRIDARLAASASLLVAGGALAGAVVTVLGEGTGGRYLEAPWWAEAAVAVGLLVGAVATTRAARSAGERLPVASWYLVAALWWGAVALGVGAVPGLDGVPAALQARFAGTVVSGLAPTAAGLGVAYFLVSQVVPESAFHPRLGRIGFWSLGFCWLWLGPRALQYGPTPDWLETIPVLFAAGLVVAAIAVMADLVWGLRGRWSAVIGSRPLQLTVAGMMALAIVPLQMLVQSTRGASAVVHLTYWEPALEQLLVFGAPTFWLLALAAFVFPGGDRVGRLSLWASGAGLATATVALWVAGLQQGYTWVASVNSGANSNVGDGFRSSVVPLEGLQAARLAGLVLLLAGTLGALVASALALRRRPPEVAEAHGVGPGGPVQVVWRGAVALVLAAGLAVFVLPVVEADEPPTVLAESSRRAAEGSAVDRGRQLYVEEGCWLCHTQQVRPIVTDVGLGPVSLAGDYAYEDADVLGSIRVGPDLAHVGSRQGTTEEWVSGHLGNPRAARPWSTMPSYDYLSSGDRDSLAAYIASLR